MKPKVTRPRLRVVGLVLLSVAGLGAEPLPPGAVARLGSARLRHSAAVRALAFAPDGRTLYAGGNEKMARAWDVTTRREVRRFVQNGSVYDLALSPDGKTLVTGDGDEVIRFWDTATGRERRRIEKKEVHSALAFSPDGRLLFGGGGPGSPHVARWDAATGEPLSPFVKFNASWSDVLAFSPDGTALATSELNVVTVWEVATGKPRFTASTGELGGVRSLVFSADGRALAGACGPSVLVWDARTGRARHRLQPEGHVVYSVAFSPDGATLAAGLFDQTARLWDVTTGKERLVLKGHTGAVRAVAYSPDGRTLATAGEDQVVRLWEANSGRELLPPGGPEGKAVAIAFSPDGRTVATAGEEKGVRLWDASTGRQVRLLTGHDRHVVALAFAPGGRFLVSGGQDFTVRLWDPRTGRERLQGKHGLFVRGLAFSPDGRTLASAGYDGTIRLLTVPETIPPDRDGGPAFWRSTRLLVHPSESSIDWAAFTPDGRKVVLATMNGSLCTWDLGEAKVRAVDGAGDTFPHAAGLALAADGRALIAVHPDTQGDGRGRVCRWDLRTGKNRAVLPKEGEAVSIVRGAVPPDGRSVATVGTDNVIRLWELATGRQRRHWPGGIDGEVTAMAFAPDSRVLAVAGVDRTVLLWNTLPPAGPGKLADCWSDLAADAGTAFAAVARLAAASREGVPLLAKHLRPVPHVPPERVRRWVADLGAARFQARQEAQKELERIGEGVEPLLREALEEKPPLEVRRRIEELLALLARQELTPAQLQTGRALEALERAGTLEAVGLLKELAGGEPAAWLRREARTALGRLERLRAHGE